MASTDLEEFIQERLRAYDPNIDLTEGSTAQQQVVQPLLRRIGPDPFTMSLEKFIGTRLVQEFPEISTDDGDAIMDLLVKPARILLEPLVQEVKRVRDNLSFRDPQTLTLTEAEALGANYFSPRNRGDFARVTVRLYFSAPQNVVVTPGNYCYTGSGLRFLPTAIQSISSNQMLFNREGTYYYFDVSTIADNPGDGYNVEPGQITRIYGLPAAVKVTNKLRAVGGLPEEDVQTYVDRIEQDLTERSLVTQRGILAVLRRYFPAISRVAVVGFNDPEMRRDVLRGMGVGPIVASGTKAYPVSDGTGGPSRRLMVDDAVDFTALIGPVGIPVKGFTLTIAGEALLSGSVVDAVVSKVIDSKTVEIEAQLLRPWYHTITYSYWMLRRNELTLSGVAGGTQLEGPNGAVTIESDTVHIGGMTDICIRGTDVDQGVLTLESVTDDAPLLSGVKAVVHGTSPDFDGFVLQDLTLGPTGNYLDTSDIYKALDTAKDRGVSLQIMDGDAGSYRILGVTQLPGTSPIIFTDPAPQGYPLTQRWRMLDTIDVDLTLPKETKLTGADLMTVQGAQLAVVGSVADLSVYGVGKGDYLELLSGNDAGAYSITADPIGGQLMVDHTFTSSAAGVSFRIYRRLTKEAMHLPLVRIKTVDILDTGGQPIGVTIPYADPVDVRAFDFSASSQKLMVDVRDGIVGCVGNHLTNPALLSGKTLKLNCPLWPGTGNKLVTFGAVTTLGEIVDAINAQVGEHIAGIVGTDRLGISPVRTQYRVTALSTGEPATDALPLLFPTASIDQFSTNHIRSATVSGVTGGWGRFTYDPVFDVAQIVSVNFVGFADGLGAAQNGKVLQTAVDFPPSVGALVKVGARSVGKVRCYFLDPTTFEVGDGARFEATLDDGSTLGFLPNPLESAVRYPPPPTTSGATDGVTQAAGSYGKLLCNSVDFNRKGILPGDEVTITYVPIISTRANPGTNVPGLARTTFIVRIDGVERTIVFANDDNTDSTAVTKDGVVRQLNRVLGADVARFNDSGILELECSYELWVVGGSSLGYFWLVDPGQVNNWSENYRGGYKYVIFDVQKNYVLTTTPFPTLRQRQQFTITRPATQRVSATQMALNTTHSGLYYADIQLISEGVGPLYNLASGTPLSVIGHKSLGYTLTNEHEHLSFSVLERVTMHLTPVLISVGASDDLESALQIGGQNLQITYNWSSLVASLQSFVTSDAERVVNENALVRHLIPHFVRLDMAYRGGAQETVVQQAVETYIAGLNPDDPLEAVQVQNIPIVQGATSVATPINLVAVVHREDRKIVVEQSTNFLNQGRLAGFFPERINVQKRTA
jgi:hypothetical protein